MLLLRLPNKVQPVDIRHTSPVWRCASHSSGHTSHGKGAVETSPQQSWLDQTRQELQKQRARDPKVAQMPGWGDQGAMQSILDAASQEALAEYQRQEEEASSALQVGDLLACCLLEAHLGLAQAAT